MDNIVDYLVIIFFVVSAIASMFKKKKKQQPQKQGTQKSQSQTQTLKAKQPQVAKQTYKDPFEEISEMLRQPKPKTEKKSEVDLYFEDAIQKSKATKQVSQKEKTSRTIESRQAQQKINTAADDLKELEKSKESVHKRLNKIQQKLKRKTDIRELIIFNEILGKPKALRRNTNPLNPFSIR